MQEPTEEVARRHPEPPLMEVRKADDIADKGFSSSSLPGMIHSSYVMFVIRRRSPSSTSHNAIFSVKMERPHGSIEKGKKALR
jgi:hypothetical protein